MHYLSNLGFVVVAFMLSACLPSYEYWRPDTIITNSDGLEQRYHKVQPGESLYLIAWVYDLDYLKVAEWNGLEEPYQLHPGRDIRIQPPIDFSQDAEQGEIEQMSLQAEETQELVLPALEGWHWPTEGTLLCKFTQNECSNGLHISGIAGQPIYAAAPGRVVYSGQGIRHYKSLILIKHADDYFSVYANNEELLVETGDNVITRQEIASMGMDAQQRPILFFQVRKNGKPVNPLKLLVALPFST